MRWSEEEFAAYQGRRAAPMRKVGRGNKYNNVRVEIAGEKFDSKAEAQHWHELKLREKAGLISGLERQVRYSLDVNGTHVADYVADFRYKDEETGETVVSDVKGVVTDVFRLKSRLMAAIHGIFVVEVSARKRSPTGKRPAPRGTPRRKPN